MDRRILSLMLIAILICPGMAKAADDDKSVAEKVLQEPSHMKKAREGVLNALTLGYYNKRKEKKAAEEAGEEVKDKGKEAKEEAEKEAKEKAKKEKEKHKNKEKEYEGNLPPGLAKKDKLPPGLAKKDKTPGGWEKGNAGWKKDKD